MGLRDKDENPRLCDITASKHLIRFLYFYQTLKKFK
jgi:hypothetical protein